MVDVLVRRGKIEVIEVIESFPEIGRIRATSAFSPAAAAAIIGAHKRSPNTQNRNILTYPSRHSQCDFGAE